MEQLTTLVLSARKVDGLAAMVSSKVMVLL